MRAHTQARRGPCCLSRVRIALPAPWPASCCCNPPQALRRLASSFSFSSGHESRLNKQRRRLPPPQRCRHARHTSAGDSVNRRQTSAHVPRRSPSRSAATDLTVALRVEFKVISAARIERRQPRRVPLRLAPGRVTDPQPIGRARCRPPSACRNLPLPACARAATRSAWSPAHPTRPAGLARLLVAG